MPNLLTRFLGAVLAVPLALSRPLLRWGEARRRKTGAHRLRPPSQPVAGASAPRGQRLSSTETRAIIAELAKALDALPSHRQTYRHLARFERKFVQRGVHAIEEVPIELLRRALRNFEALIRNWSSPSLADLRSRMAVALADRSSAASVWIAVNSVSSTYVPHPEPMAARFARHAGAAFRPSQHVDVGDISMSRFEAEANGWHSTSAQA